MWDATSTEGRFRITPYSSGFRMPAEWQRHSAIWTAWPSHANLWRQNLKGAQDAVADMCRAVVNGRVDHEWPAERLELLVPNERVAEQTRKRLPSGIRIHVIPFGDIWLRDTGPIFLKDSRRDHRLAAVRFGFNGWGGKYKLPHDDEVAERIVRAAGFGAYREPSVFEGGSVDVDGEGSCLTTRQCLLNGNRNPGLTEKKAERLLKDALGCEHVIWLDRGLKNDHTDGHVDNIARFVRPGTVVCMEASGSNDPNRDVFAEIWKTLKQAKNATGEKLALATIPSPGRMTNRSGKVVPASYLNFVIANRAVVVPIYGVEADGRAVDALAKLFPDRRVTGIDSRALLSGGGSFHCITQQQPASE